MAVYTKIDKKQIILLAKKYKLDESIKFQGIKNGIENTNYLGIAMQLTNISRDVIDDAKNNRFYISKNFNSIKETLKFADLFYDSSFVSIKEIPLSCRLSILVARRVYRKIGHNIYNSAGGFLSE